ncbi:MAG TPA: hypothetical protein PKD85_06460 [Saprospiraceae bacterium]|nr:hypothetical protein [Saprospiraceae bacterium]
MRYAINFLLLGLIVFAGFLVYKSIQDPIAFQAEKEVRKSAVAKNLQEIRTLQEIYRSITGSFAGSYEELVSVISKDSIPFENIIGDPDDPTNLDKIQRITTYASAADSVKALGINLEGLNIVPFSEGKKFEFFADTIEYQSTKVHVVEVSTTWKDFMGSFADPKYRKFDNRYDPEAPFKFGDRNTPSLNGTWQ